MSEPSASTPRAPEPAPAPGSRLPSAGTPRKGGSGLEGVLAVATLAFRESARNRVLHALIAATLLLAVLAHLAAWVTGDDLVRRAKIVADLSLSSIVLLGTIASIFLGTNLIYTEVERRTIYTVLARPIGRGGFILGKYLGLTAVMALATLAMGAGFLIIYALGGGAPTGAMVVAIGYGFLELAVVIAIALFFSVAAHPIEGAVFAFVVALAGHVTEDLLRLGNELVRAPAGQEPSALAVLGAKLLWVIYVLVPNLETMNLRGYAAHGLPLDEGRLLGGPLYAVVYVAVLLCLSTLVFRRKGL